MPVWYQWSLLSTFCVNPSFLKALFPWEYCRGTCTSFQLHFTCLYDLDMGASEQRKGSGKGGYCPQHLTFLPSDLLHPCTGLGHYFTIISHSLVLSVRCHPQTRIQTAVTSEVMPANSSIQLTMTGHCSETDTCHYQDWNRVFSLAPKIHSSTLIQLPCPRLEGGPREGGRRPQLTMLVQQDVVRLDVSARETQAEV